MRCFTMKIDFFLLTALFLVISLVTSSDKICISNGGTISDDTKTTVILSLLNNSKSVLEEAMSFAAMKSRCQDEDSVGDVADEKPMDCSGILEINPKAKSGIYAIWPRNRNIEGSIDVYCDMDDGAGAWTVIQRRGNFGSNDDQFFIHWDAYKKGFGDLQKDFWLGNDKISALTTQRSNTIKFVLTDWEGVTKYALYDDFWIEDETRNYTMHVSEYSGIAGDSLKYHNGHAFSTRDRDNSGYNCAMRYTGAWWYNNCLDSNLNGKYYEEKQNVSGYNTDGLLWRTFRGDHYSLKDTVIKIQSRLVGRK